MVWIGLIITIGYLVLITSFIIGFKRISPYKLKLTQSKTNFSVVIPFRNEAENLPLLLQSLEQLSYPKKLFEIILVNDASEDKSLDIISNFILNSKLNITVLENDRQSKSPKKDAISTAVKKSKYDWIITTDADCEFPRYWLNSFDEIIIKTNAKCISGPVSYLNRPSFLHKFQILDLHSLQGATIGGFGINQPFLCNGANFAYQKYLFIELDGFEGNNQTASGDDIFLLEKIAKNYPKTLTYLKCEDAIVSTKTQPSWRQLINQRIRWAAKTSRYKNAFGKLTGIAVLLMNILVISLLLLTWIHYTSTFYFLAILLSKFMVDYVIISKAALFFKQKQVLKTFPLAFIFYPFFSVYVAIKSIFSEYTWKGRQFKK
ncbi:glycosyltransferase [Gaetbulibacter saemankumensis]|uniref:glycosyltransferase n=1 Tax=Gaetbulibacter saemankumensis TaxID=311208 RepID=UPI0003F9026A|nr:glycosyltransferase [Gaetbulibacter saemankumensis]